MKIKKKHNKYHTNLISAVQLDMVPEDILKKIPASTLSRFRNKDVSSYIGHNLTQAWEENLQTIKEIAGNPTLLKVNKAYLFMVRLFFKWFGNIPKDLPMKIKQKVVYFIERIKSRINLQKLLKILGITLHKFYKWKAQVTFKCKESFLSLCLRKYPNQLTQKELDTMKSFFLNPNYKGWSVFSVAKRALRDGVLSVSVNTWRKYIWNSSSL